MHSVLTHRAHRVLTGAATAAAAVRDDRIEAQSAGVVLVARRRRPEVATIANAAELTIPAFARSGKENSATVRSSELPTIYAVLRCPLICTIADKFFYLFQRRCTRHLTELVIAAVCLRR